MTGGSERPSPAIGAERVQVECLACGHRATIGPEGELDRLPLVQLTRRLRCSACGSRAVKAARAETPRDVARLLRSRIDGRRP